MAELTVLSTGAEAGETSGPDIKVNEGQNEHFPGHSLFLLFSQA